MHASVQLKTSISDVASHQLSTSAVATVSSCQSKASSSVNSVHQEQSVSSCQVTDSSAETSDRTVHIVNGNNIEAADRNNNSNSGSGETSHCNLQSMLPPPLKLRPYGRIDQVEISIIIIIITPDVPCESNQIILFADKIQICFTHDSTRADKQGY